MIDKIDKKFCEKLVYAIIMQACEDYEKSLWEIKHPTTHINSKKKLTKEETEKRLNKIHQNAVNTAADCEHFFQSTWCAQLLQSDELGKRIMKKIQRNVKNGVRLFKRKEKGEKVNGIIQDRADGKKKR